jgi:hypothetical protein
MGKNIKIFKEKYKSEKSILEFAKRVYDVLVNINNIYEVKYSNPQNFEEQDEDLLVNVSKRALIYAIHEEIESKWHLTYIGQTQAKTSRQRIRNHLFKKHEETGSKLAKVTECIKKAHKIGISIVEMEPDYMRLPIEEILIEEKKPEWNIHKNTNK